MKAISIRQPWAWLIVNGFKNIENRTWQTKYRGPILIHAGLTVDREAETDFRVECRRRKIPFPKELEKGGIVGRVEIVDCITHSHSRWFEGPCGFILRRAKPLPFFACRGKLGIFEVDYPEPLDEPDTPIESEASPWRRFRRVLL